jgi:hypothetical protein
MDPPLFLSPNQANIILTFLDPFTPSRSWSWLNHQQDPCLVEREKHKPSKEENLGWMKSIISQWMFQRYLQFNFKKRKKKCLMLKSYILEMGAGFCEM